MEQSAYGRLPRFVEGVPRFVDQPLDPQLATSRDKLPAVLFWVETGSAFVEIFVFALGGDVSQESMRGEFVTDYAANIDNDISECVGRDSETRLQYMTSEAFCRTWLFARFAWEKFVSQSEEQTRERLANFTLISH